MPTTPSNVVESTHVILPAWRHDLGKAARRAEEVSWGIMRPCHVDHGLLLNGWQQHRVGCASRRSPSRAARPSLLPLVRVARPAGTLSAIRFSDLKDLPRPMALITAS